MLPVGGFVGSLVFWWGLPSLAKIVGGLWLLIGLIYGAVRTRGFRLSAPPMDFSEQ